MAVANWSTNTAASATIARTGASRRAQTRVETPTRNSAHAMPTRISSGRMISSRSLIGFYGLRPAGTSAAATAAGADRATGGAAAVTAFRVGKDEAAGTGT